MRLENKFARPLKKRDFVEKTSGSFRTGASLGRWCLLAIEEHLAGEAAAVELQAPVVPSPVTHFNEAGKIEGRNIVRTSSLRRSTTVQRVLHNRTPFLCGTHCFSRLPCSRSGSRGLAAPLRDRGQLALQEAEAARGRRGVGAGQGLGHPRRRVRVRGGGERARAEGVPPLYGHWTGFAKQPHARAHCR